MNLATHAGLIAGTSVLTIASTGTAGDLDSVIDGIINDSATISGDDAFSISGMFQYGFVYDMDAAAGADEFTHDIGEARLDFSGTNGDFEWNLRYQMKANVYQVAQDLVVGGDGTTDDNSLSAYTVKYNMDNGLMLKFGRDRAYFSRESYVDTSEMLGLTASASALITGLYTNAIGVGYEADQFRGIVQLHDSFTAGGVTTDVTDADGDPTQAMTFRGEFLVMGDWGAMSNFNSAAGSESTLVVGLGWGDEDSFDGQTYDISYYMDKMCVSVAMYDVLDGGFESTTINASYFVTDDGQAYFRYEDIDGIDDETIGIGYNQYYSDSVRANVEYLDNGDDEVLAGFVQFTF